MLCLFGSVLLFFGLEMRRHAKSDSSFFWWKGVYCFFFVLFLQAIRLCSFFFAKGSAVSSWVQRCVEAGPAIHLAVLRWGGLGSSAESWWGRNDAFQVTWVFVCFCVLVVFLFLISKKDQRRITTKTPKGMLFGWFYVAKNLQKAWHLWVSW